MAVEGVVLGEVTPNAANEGVVLAEVEAPVVAVAVAVAVKLVEPVFTLEPKPEDDWTPDEAVTFANEKLDVGLDDKPANKPVAAPAEPLPIPLLLPVPVELPKAELVENENDGAEEADVGVALGNEKLGAEDAEEAGAVSELKLEELRNENAGVDDELDWVWVVELKLLEIELDDAPVKLGKEVAGDDMATEEKLTAVVPNKPELKGELKVVDVTEAEDNPEPEDDQINQN